MTILGKIRPVGAGAAVILSLMLGLFVSGCSSGTGTSGAGLGLVDSQGNHPVSFMSAHPSFAVSNAEQCKPCHGDDLTGGIAKISCFTAVCHHNTIPTWSNFDSHGAAAKRAPGSSGFQSCQICHGNGFSAKLGTSGQNCFDCHGVPAPHPSGAWRDANTNNPTHTNTDAANAAVCAACHFPGSPINPAGFPSAPAPPGTLPGCFNSTLCHGQVGAPHPTGGAWVTVSPAAQPHGNDAKTVPGATTGFAYCQACHGAGTDFAGGSSGISCYTAGCHGTNAPHPSAWRTGDSYLHTSTDEGNTSVCAFCHANGANSPIAPPSPPAPAGTTPGCFNSTLCHGQVGAPHPTGGAWVTVSPAAQPHGDDANAAPGATTGFAYCQACHGAGTDFAGGSSGISCYTAGCHGTNAPHPSAWRTGDTYDHTIFTDEGNASVCAFCHTNGANSPIAPPSPPAPAGTTPGCFNNTLCHGAPHNVPFLNHTGVTSDTFNDPYPSGCADCHAESGLRHWRRHLSVRPATPGGLRLRSSTAPPAMPHLPTGPRQPPRTRTSRERISCMTGWRE